MSLLCIRRWAMMMMPTVGANIHITGTFGGCFTDIVTFLLQIFTYLNADFTDPPPASTPSPTRCLFPQRRVLGKCHTTHGPGADMGQTERLPASRVGMYLDTTKLLSILCLTWQFVCSDHHYSYTSADNVYLNINTPSPSRSNPSLCWLASLSFVWDYACRSF